MLDQQLREIARRRIITELVEDNHRLESEIATVVNDMSARGMLSSGITVTRLIRVHEDAIQRRVANAWATLHRFITAPGISYSETLCDELKDIVGSLFPENRYEEAVRERIKRVVPSESKLHRPGTHFTRCFEIRTG
jgi:hypothetical protein